MASMTPVGVYCLEVPTGGVAIPSFLPHIMEEAKAGTFRVTMAAINPEEPEDDESPESEKKTDTKSSDPIRRRAVLKLVKRSSLDDESDEEEDESSDESGESDDEKEKVKTKKAEKVEKAKKAKKTEKAGKGDAMDVDADSDEDSDSDDEGDSEPTEEQDEEFVLCVLDGEKNPQQAIDLTISTRENYWFKTVGNATVYLTGNYVMTANEIAIEERGLRDSYGLDDYDSDEEDDEDFDFADMNQVSDDEDEEDELDGLTDPPRLVELEDDEDEEDIKPKDKKSLKRAAEEEASAEPEKKLSKKQLKKLKANDGKAVAAAESPADKKKVQFAAQLEQGPSPVKETKKDKKDKKAEKAEKSDKSEKKKEPAAPAESKPKETVVQGIKIEDKVVGQGAVAKKGQRVEMRYIGKLTNGKVFDKNTSGKPFAFSLGKGEVIDGWDLGIAGMKVGGERKLVIPPEKGYGRKSLPGIPSGSTLCFEVKLLKVR